MLAVLLGVIWLVTRERGGSTTGAGRASASNAPGEPVELPERSIPPTAAAAPPPPGRPAVTTGVAHPSPTDPSRPLALRPTRETYDLLAGLGDLQARIDGCAAGASPEALGDRSRSIVWLELETLAGKVRITEAQVDQQGGASPALLDCALGVLRGQVLTMRVAKPGSHLRLRYPLAFRVRPQPAP
jgi:hypothetical protein